LVLSLRRGSCGRWPIRASGVEAVGAADLRRMADLVEQYADLPLGTTDACVIAVAERLNHVNVATLDRRHFTVVRPHHAAALVLLP
jgi:uncharacterized protein